MENMLSEHILERQGCPLHYWLGGQPGQPLLVLIHGACVDHHSFDQQIPILTARYRVLAVDVRGHGLSRPMGTKFNVPLAVEDLLALLDLWAEPKAVFIGHSNGTYIAQELAFRHPERVQALVIADGTCITWEHSPLENWMVRVSPGLMTLFPFETLKKSGLSGVSAKKEVQEYTYSAYSQLTKADFIQIWRGAVASLHAEPDYRIQQPLLLVHGDEDSLGDIRKIAPRWAAREPNCEYKIIPHARHLAMLDNPAVFNQVLLDFLARWAPVV